MNSFGTLFRLTDFGESHSKALGGIIDGVQPGLRIDMDRLQQFIERRHPGQRATTPRREDDLPEFLSGLDEENVALGTPIGFIIRNRDTRPADYAEMTGKLRPNHADYTYHVKYGGFNDRSGGGRSSARQTVCRVVAGGIAMQQIAAKGVSICSRLLRPTIEEVEEVARRGDSVGGLVECTIEGVPAGIGEPVYDKLQARLAGAMLGINAVKGFEYGLGFEAAEALGSETLDLFNPDFSTRTNNSGGIQGGISNGMPITFRVAFKPTPTIFRDIETVTFSGEPATLKAKGRHDPCVAVRGQVVVEAMAALVVADMMALAHV